MPTPTTTNRWRLIGGLATALAALSVAVGSGATFTSKTANPSNTVTSGTLLQTNSKSGAAIVTGSDLKPGDRRTGDVTISNTGTLAGDFTLVEKNATSGFSAGNLNLRIDDVTSGTAVNVYDGDFEKVASGGLSLGTYAAGAARTYRFTVTLAQAAPNSEQGKSASADIEWNAVQS
jgi:spore coat-associated protein N